MTSLPGAPGVGDLGPAAHRFLDWLAAAGQRVWQVLPVTPAGAFASPYDGRSACAGHPLLISPERLVTQGLLAARDLADPPRSRPDRVAFGRVEPWRRELLHRAWDRHRSRPAAGVDDALSALAARPETAGWLDDWCLFAALKEEQAGRPWWRWPQGVRRREPRALVAARGRLAEAVERHRFWQALFFQQWAELRAAAAQRGILLFGDVPIYVARDSADAWAQRHLLSLDRDGVPTAQAGVPPDAFTATGQLWGNPLYRWDAVAAEGYSWWVQRVAVQLRLFDLLRLDHFRGLAGYWAVPAGASTAAGGRWEPGPGNELLRALTDALGRLPLVAEDLGVITPDVEALRRRWHLPGMRVLQFAFGGGDSPHLPHRHSTDCVVYTGTHDNAPSRSWSRGLDPATRERARRYLGAGRRPLHRQLVRAALTSVAHLAVVPLQDVLGLGGAARMNYPGRARGNWTWRARESQLAAAEADRLRDLVALAGR